MPQPADEETLQIARRFFDELAAAVDARRLDLELLGDAFGVAAWAIDAPMGQAPHPARVTMLADDRVRYVIMNFPYGEPPTSTTQMAYV